MSRNLLLGLKQPIEIHFSLEILLKILSGKLKFTAICIYMSTLSSNIKKQIT